MRKKSRRRALVCDNFLALDALGLPHSAPRSIALAIRFFLLFVWQDIHKKHVRDLARISKNIKASSRKIEFFAKFYGIFPIFADLSKIITNFSSFFAKDIAILSDFCYNIRIWIRGADFLCFWTSQSPFHTIIL
jgi:hypothetical protein